MGVKTVFLLTDVQIKQESFLEDVDNLLNTGEVPNLYSSEERAEITELVQTAMEAMARQKVSKKGSGVGGGAAQAQDTSPLALFSAFVNRCRANLHLVIAFSPIGDAFRNRLRQFPALINCCTIDWFMVCCHNITGHRFNP